MPKNTKTSVGSTVLSSAKGISVNDFIDKELCSVKYSTIDDAIKMIHKLGKNAKLAKCDIKFAFRLLRLSAHHCLVSAFPPNKKSSR
jgi:hypothetical protein